MNDKDLKLSVPAAIAAHRPIALFSALADHARLAINAALRPWFVFALPGLISSPPSFGWRLTRYVASASLGFLGLFGLAAQSLAAGGHYSVEDAVILEPQQCQVDTWLSRENGGARTLAHLGPACRLGPVELSLNLDRTRQIGSKIALSGGPQIKWASPVTESLSAGIVVSTNLQNGPVRFTGNSLVFPLTWQARETVLIHANLGRDFRRGAPDTNRAGVAAEWAPLAQWSLITERYRENATNFWRVGTRYALNSSLNLDLSQARGLNKGELPFWTFGATWLFDR